MMTRCFNAACGRELRYLRTGRVVRVTRNQAGRHLVEHFWLCGDCYRFKDFRFSEDGSVSLAPKAGRKDSVDGGFALDNVRVTITA